MKAGTAALANVPCTASSGTTPEDDASQQLRATLERKSVKALKEECRVVGISGYSSKRRDELTDLLLRAQSKAVQPPTSPAPAPAPSPAL